jgi:glycosyltransferase involved in cell wall biosynthesis
MEFSRLVQAQASIAPSYGHTLPTRKPCNSYATEGFKGRSARPPRGRIPAAGILLDFKDARGNREGKPFLTSSHTRHSVLSGQDIIYISADWARETKTSAHHIAEVLAERNKVLYVEAAGMRTPRASGRDIRKIFTKLRKLWSLPVKMEGNLYLYSPTVLPFHHLPLIPRINRFLISALLRRACQAIAMKNPLIWIYTPHYHTALDAVPARGIVYYITDEYSSNPNVDPETIRFMERKILKRADVTFAVSNQLIESKKPLAASNIYLSRHGVDFEMFNKATDESTVIPDDIADIPHPIAGFFGLIEEWIDLHLVEHVARALPRVSFVLIGRSARDLSQLHKLPNVHILGHRKYDRLPGYLKAFDACMLIYKKGDFSRNANPKKLREYLAAGKPIVSVRLGEVEEFDEHVSIADDYDEYARALEDALKNDSPEKRRSRMDAVRSLSWEHRVEWLGDTISREIPGVSTVDRKDT